MKENIFTWLLLKFIEAVFALHEFTIGFARFLKFTWGEFFIVMSCILVLMIVSDRHMKRAAEKNARLARHRGREKRLKLRKRKTLMRKIKKKNYHLLYRMYERIGDFFFDKAEEVFQQYQQLIREEEGRR